jgi:mRNA interferase RelE/StbE
MLYKLRFHEAAWAEWQKLDGSIRTRLKKKLAERLQQPHVPGPALSGMPNCYKIKLASLGYRLVYQVEEDVLYVSVIAIVKREQNPRVRQHLQKSPLIFCKEPSIYAGLHGFKFVF